MYYYSVKQKQDIRGVAQPRGHAPDRAIACDPIALRHSPHEGKAGASLALVEKEGALGAQHNGRRAQRASGLPHERGVEPQRM